MKLWNTQTSWKLPCVRKVVIETPTEGVETMEVGAMEVVGAVVLIAEMALAQVEDLKGKETLLIPLREEEVRNRTIPVEIPSLVGHRQLRMADVIKGITNLGLQTLASLRKRRRI